MQFPIFNAKFTFLIAHLFLNLFMAIISPIVCLTHDFKWCQFECILMLIQAHILNCKQSIEDVQYFYLPCLKEKHYKGCVLRGNQSAQRTYMVIVRTIMCTHNKSYTTHSSTILYALNRQNSWLHCQLVSCLTNQPSISI